MYYRNRKEGDDDKLLKAGVIQSSKKVSALPLVPAGMDVNDIYHNKIDWDIIPDMVMERILQIIRKDKVILSNSNKYAFFNLNSILK